MNCEIARRLAEINDPTLAEHRRTCAACVVGAHARYYEAPPALEQKIRQSLRHEVARPAPWRLLALAASVLLLVSAGWNVILLRSRVDPVSIDVLSAHVRSLAGTHLLDVPSTDQHTVKPWFAGKLDFSPPVKEIADFPLLGGRMEYLDGHSAAALVYGRRNHTINVFCWPSQTRTAESTETRNGYNLVSWWANQMAFWAVSDLNPAELGQFVSLYRHE